MPVDEGGDRTRIGRWRPQVGLHGGRGGIHVHVVMHVPAERCDAAVAHLRGEDQHVVEQAFSERGRGRLRRRS
jgi:hypothetical protein